MVARVGKVTEGSLRQSRPKRAVKERGHNLSNHGHKDQLSFERLTNGGRFANRDMNVGVETAAGMVWKREERTLKNTRDYWFLGGNGVGVSLWRSCVLVARVALTKNEDTQRSGGTRGP